MLRLWPALASFLVWACAAAPPPQTPDLASVLEARVAQGFSGVVLVARGEDILLFDGFGRLAGEEVSREASFWIASTGKQFAAAAVLLLAEEERLHLDAPLSSFIPEAPADKAAITLRQLLSHTSGLGQSYVSEQQSERAAAVAAMLAEPLEGPPGERFRYSNSNIQLAAAVVEIVSGASYQDFVRERLFAPAGLQSTGFAEADRGASAPHNELPERLRRAYWGEQGAYSNAGDLMRWYAALTGGAILSDASLRELFTAHARIGEGEAALGWFLGQSPRGRPVRFTRGNEDFGANSLIYAYPQDDVLIVVLTHAGDAPEGPSWSRLVHRDIETALLL